MKRIFMSAVALLLATAALQAQTDTAKAPRREHHKMQKNGAYKQMNLSAEQQAKLKSLREEAKQKRDALNSQKLTEAERSAQLQALRKQHKAEVESLLTPVQKEELAKLKSERKAGMGNRKSFRGDSTTRNMKGGREDRSTSLRAELNLTAEQQAKAKEMRTDYKAKAETVRNDQALTQDQKREKLRELMKQHQEQFKTILTKEQQEKLQATRNERPVRNTK